MKFTIKKIIFTIFVFSLLLTQEVFAAKDPTFETLSAVSITDDIAFLRGEFNSRENNYFPTNQPIVWFEYGRDRNDLDKTTVETAKIKGNYIVTQGISGLRDDTKYYYRAVISFDGDRDYGDKLSFYTEPQQEEITLEEKQTDNNFPSPNDITSQYYAGIAGNNKSSSGEFTDGGAVGRSEPLSFSSFFSWFRGGSDKNNNTDSNQNSNLVTSEEEINKNISEQENFKNSASNNDELGEVVEYNTNYNNYGRGSASLGVNSNSNRLNYPILLFIVLILVLIVTFIYIVLRKRRRKMYMSRRPVVRQQQFRPNTQSRNPHNPQRHQNTNNSHGQTPIQQNPNNIVPENQHPPQNQNRPE